MDVRQLDPVPIMCAAFDFEGLTAVPEAAGCYVLTNDAYEIMDIGFASDLRRRLGRLAANPNKTAERAMGRASVFWWKATEDWGRLDSLWSNAFLMAEHGVPVLW